MKIREGYRIGKLTVASDTGKRKNGYMIWQCACDCGGTIELDTRTLQRETIRDCGCITKVKPGQNDLTGQYFGKLEALEPTKMRDVNGVTIWRCQCNCGNEALVSAALLKNGYKKSCGCLRRPNVEDLTGKQFGELTVLGYSDSRNGMRFWHCKCSCGKETTVRQGYLLDGRTKSCGCLQAKIIRDNMKFVEGTSVTMLEKVQSRLNSSNTSGHNGIYFNQKNQKWIAQITYKKKTYYLGSFSSIEDAVSCRKAAEERIYGEFLDNYYTQNKE